MRFGLFVPQGWRLDLVGVDSAEQWSVMRDVARHADEGPWESVWVYDHFHTVPRPTDEACHEAWTLMAALGASTERVRLGQMCSCMSYRNPAYLAKVAATCDIVSGGRVEMGIGGGWYEHEWRAYGYGFPPLPERLAVLGDHLAVISEMLKPGRASYEGRYAHVRAAINEPKGLQQPRIPIIVGGNGPKVTAGYAIKYADELNYVFLGPDETADRMRQVRERCEVEGRDPGTLRFSMYARDEHMRDTGQARVDLIGRFAEIGLDRLVAFPTRWSPTLEAQAAFADDCEAAGVELDGRVPA